MRLLIWSQYFWPENFIINPLAKALQRLDAEVSVLTGKPNYPEGKVFEGYRARGLGCDRFGQIDIFRVPVIPRGKRSRLGLALNYLSFILSAFFFAPVLLRKKKVDVIFVYAPSPLLQALPALAFGFFRRVPVVLWVQDLWPESLVATKLVTNRWLLKVVLECVRIIYRHVDLVLVQSEAFIWPISCLGINREKIAYFPNPAEEIRSEGMNGDLENLLTKRIRRGFSVVFSGNIGSVQSCETIVRAAEVLKGIPDIQFFLIGDGSSYDSVKAEVINRGLNNVHMPGRISSTEMAAVFSVAKILVLTLRRDPVLALTVPSKLQAYLSAGCPIVACVDGEAARIVNEAEAGLACPAEDFESLANAIAHLYSLPEHERRKYGENGVSYFFKHYEMTSQAIRLLNLLRPFAAKT